MTITGQELVGGETVADLVEALQGLKLEPARGGMAKVNGLIGPPAIRALMRIEAELLLADADAWATAAQVDRTDGQRRADALVLLVERMAMRAGDLDVLPGRGAAA